jgi:hypothetical protein
MATITTQPQHAATTHLDLNISQPSGLLMVQPRARLLRLRWMEDFAHTSEYHLGSGFVLERLPKASKA